MASEDAREVLRSLHRAANESLAAWMGFVAGMAVVFPVAATDDPAAFGFVDKLLRIAAAIVLGVAVSRVVRHVGPRLHRPRSLAAVEQGREHIVWGYLSSWPERRLHVGFDDGRRVSLPCHGSARQAFRALAPATALWGFTPETETRFLRAPGELRAVRPEPPPPLPRSELSMPADLAREIERALLRDQRLQACMGIALVGLMWLLPLLLGLRAGAEVSHAVLVKQPAALLALLLLGAGGVALVTAWIRGPAKTRAMRWLVDPAQIVGFEAAHLPRGRHSRVGVWLERALSPKHDMEVRLFSGAAQHTQLWLPRRTAERLSQWLAEAGIQTDGGS